VCVCVLSLQLIYPMFNRKSESISVLSPKTAASGPYLTSGS
jgi:hypothetical protein